MTTPRADEAVPRARDAPRAWLLNLDAELELRAPHRYQPTKSSLAACSAFEAPARQLLAEGDVLLRRGDLSHEVHAPGYRGVAWCPTPSALAALRRAGASLPEAPSLQCLQRVNHRHFHMRLGSPLRGAFLTTTLEQARKVLLGPSPQGWMVKRGFGFAGRGNRHFPRLPSPDDWRWLEHAFHDGAVQIEPRVQVLEEYSIHGWLTRDGQLTVGSPCWLRPRSALGYQRIDQACAALPPEDFTSLRAEAEHVAGALHAEGYFGPFGIDAYRYLEDDVTPRFNPRSEINARFTLAYALGMAAHSLW